MELNKNVNPKNNDRETTPEPEAFLYKNPPSIKEQRAKAIIKRAKATKTSRKQLSKISSFTARGQLRFNGFSFRVKWRLPQHQYSCKPESAFYIKRSDDDNDPPQASFAIEVS